MPVFTLATDMMGDPKFEKKINKNGSRDPDHAHLRVVCHAKAKT